MMIEGLLVVALALVAYSIWAMLELNGRARDERKELEDRLMSVCQPIPLTQVMSDRRDDYGSVTYVDEEEPTARKRIKSHEA